MFTFVETWDLFRSSCRGLTELHLLLSYCCFKLSNVLYTSNSFYRVLKPSKSKNQDLLSSQADLVALANIFGVVVKNVSTLWRLGGVMCKSFKHFLGFLLRCQEV